jgi:peptidyl-prolyl cis-trans isomerase D
LPFFHKKPPKTSLQRGFPHFAHTPDCPIFAILKKARTPLPMSVIQKIRDKYARVAVIAIALALLGFILMDAFAGRSSIFGGQDTTIGKINGTKIDAEEFTRRVSEITRRPNFEGENGTAQAVNGLWQEEVTNRIMGEQYEELGLTVSDKELDQILFSPEPLPEVRQVFGNPEKWDPATLRQSINQIKKTGTPDQKEDINQRLDYVVKLSLQNKYIALLANSVYIPKWFLEKRNVDNSLAANAAYVSVPYTTIADSTVKVSDGEIDEYVKAHPKQFEQKEETRSISYVAFSADPSPADSAAVRNQLLALKDSFQRAGNVKDFLLTTRSLEPYSDAYVTEQDLNLQNKDSVLKSAVGGVAGPLVEPGRMLLTKIVDRKTEPDTVKVRHILVALNPTDMTGQPTGIVRDSVVAKHLADSVQQAIAVGAVFDSVAVKVSDDWGSKFRGGVYDSITHQTGFVPEFKDFAFNNPVGTKGVVKTQFGYHYMEVLSQRGSSPVYKLALLALPIEASSETQSQASNEAAMFAGNAKDEKSFDQYFEKNLKGKGYQKQVAPNLRPMDFAVTGLDGTARELVKEVFEAEKGEIVNPSQSINNRYIVAVVTDVNKPGLPSANSARSIVEPELLKKKKAEMIKSKMGKVTDLNAVAAKFGQAVQPADSLRFSGGGSTLGFEPRVLGAVFNPANKGKICPDPIAGKGGVYAIRTDAVFTMAVENADIEQQRQMMEMQSRQMLQARSPLEVLQKKADIKDYRNKFY